MKHADCKLIYITIFAICILVFQTIYGQWKQLDGFCGGYFVDIGFGKNGTVFAATTSSIYKSSDNGLNWSPTDSIFTMGDITAITVIGNRLTVYTLHNGKFYSTDEGKHWAPLPEQGSDKQTFSVAAGSNGELIARGYFMSARSTNGGETWADIEGIPFRAGCPLVITEDGVYISGPVENSPGSIRSIDHGITWSSPDTTAGWISSLGIRKNGDIFALSSKGLFLSSDDGATWIQTCSSLPFHNFTSMITGRTGELLVGSTSGIYRSADNGRSWSAFDNNLPYTCIHCLSIDSTGIIYAATYGGGVFISTDNGNSWSSPLSGIALTPVYSLAVSLRGEIVAGTHGGIFIKGRDQKRITRTTSGLPVNLTALSLASDSYHGIIAASDSGLFQSRDDGETWTILNKDMSADNYIHKLLICKTGNLVVTNRNGIYISPDQGKTWSEPNHGQKFPSILSFTADGDSILYAGTMKGVLRSSNSGMKWVSTGSGLPKDVMVTAIAVTRNHTVIAGTREKGIYRSFDRGAQWQQTAEELPDTMFINSIVTDSNGNCFSSSGNGVVLLSRDDGVSWTGVGTGLPSDSIYSLAISDNQLFAGTGNHGIWRRPVSEMTGIQTPGETVKNHCDKKTESFSVMYRNDLPVIISFTLPQRQLVECSVYSISGCRIASLAKGNFMRGEHRLSWYSNNANGCFVVYLKTGRLFSKKIVNIVS